ncbi:MAG: hypothetical protein PUD55_02885 [Firmicutes bacterium]|nr:hypothetical protein [Bacillota bacterium]
MADSKGKNKSAAQRQQQIAKKSKRRDSAARIMAIVMIGVMLVFTFVTAGIFLLD